jgi:acetyl esterase/lipase
MVVYVPGGAWYKEKQEWLREPTVRYLCRQGFVVFNVSYRLAPEYTFPTQVNDVLGAVLFAKTHAAEYKADPDRTAIIGDSAGANLAAMAALMWDSPHCTPSFRGDGKVTARTQANAFLFGVYDLVEMYHLVSFYAIFDNPRLAGERYLGGTPEQVPDRYRMASPIHHIRKDMSPTLIVCGSNDPLFHQSEAFHDKLDQIGVPNAFYISVADNHGFTMYPPPFTKGAVDCYAAITAFLELELKYSRRAEGARTQDNSPLLDLKCSKPPGAPSQNNPPAPK